MRRCFDGEHGSKARNSDMMIGDDKEEAQCGCGELDQSRWLRVV